MNGREEVATSTIIRDGEGLTLGSPDLRRNRFLLDADQTERRISVVEHTVGPRVLAGPLHLHTREDEYSPILEGRLGALLGGEELYADGYDPEALPALAAEYGCRVDFQGTAEVAERFGLSF